MKIVDGLTAEKASCSFEFFPPKTDDGMAKLLDTVKGLRSLKPLFVSVTYGAAGSSRERTIRVARRIKHELEMDVLVHVTCVGSTRDDLRRLFDDLAESGIENILALRGDPPEGQKEFHTAKGGLSYASELVELLQKEYSFCIGAACYPETHIEAPDAETDLLNLKKKVDAGARFLISQLFFDNARFRAFVDRARVAGIHVPIIAGIMPITDARQVSRFTEMCGASIPQDLQQELHYREEEPHAVADLGVAYATLQSADLLRQGTDGLHFYTLNRSPATRAVVSALRATGLT